MIIRLISPCIAHAQSRITVVLIKSIISFKFAIINISCNDFVVPILKQIPRASNAFGAPAVNCPVTLVDDETILSSIKQTIWVKTIYLYTRQYEYYPSFTEG